jgi:hypothetical protein
MSFGAKCECEFGVAFGFVCVGCDTEFLSIEVDDTWGDGTEFDGTDAFFGLDDGWVGFIGRVGGGGKGVVSHSECDAEPAQDDQDGGWVKEDGKEGSEKAL